MYHVNAQGVDERMINVHHDDDDDDDDDVVMIVLLHDLFQNSTIPDYQRFYQGIQQLSKSDPSVLSPDFDVHKSKVLQEKYAFYLATNEYFSVWSAETCLLTKLPEAYKSTSLGFYLQKGSPFTKMISAK